MMNFNFTFRSLPRVYHENDGATALEFAVIAPALFLLIMGTIELALVMSAQNVMESATFSASRLGKTGYVDDGKTQAEVVMQEFNEIGSTLLDEDLVTVSSLAYSDYDSIGEPEPFQDANGNGARDGGESYTDVNGNGQYDLDQGQPGYGAAGDIVVYTVSYPWRIFTPLVSSVLGTDGTITLSARAVVRNEPF